MSEKKKKNKARTSIIKAQEELLSNSINGLCEALDLLHKIVRTKESYTTQGIHSKKTISEMDKTKATQINIKNKTKTKTDHKVNTNYCSKGFTLH